jgi:hypothetical protein
MFPSVIPRLSKADALKNAYQPDLVQRVIEMNGRTSSSPFPPYLVRGVNSGSEISIQPLQYYTLILLIVTDSVALSGVEYVVGTCSK